MPTPYPVPAEGRDIYRNFVLPAGLTTPRYVKGYEFRPGNFKIVHHTFIKVDSTSRSRRLAAREAAPGFPGMDGPAETPSGQLLGWQPVWNFSETIKRTVEWYQTPPTGCEKVTRQQIADYTCKAAGLGLNWAKT